MTQPCNVRANALVLAKLTRPVLPSGYCPRPRLMERLDAVRHRRIICIVAPVGSGKTSAALEYAQHLEEDRIGSVAWLSTDEQDRDSFRFWAHVCAALGLEADFLAPAVAFDENMLAAIGNALFEKVDDGSDFFLFVDSFDSIRNEEVESAFLRFCSYAPPSFHVILTADALSKRFNCEAFDLGRAMIGLDDLALTFEEAHSLIGPSLLGEEGTEERMSEVYRITEGWLQGVVLASEALAASAHRSEPGCFDGANRFVRQYFEGRVRMRLPGELVSFLLGLSIFECFSRPLCDVVFGSGDTQALFSEMLRRNLFVVTCDDNDEWYRLNNLFADWLRNEALQLRTETVREWCARASEWFYDHGYENEAVKYLLLASDFDYVENLTEATCSLSRSNKKIPCLLWLCRIPSVDFAKSPLLCMLSAWSCITNARAADAQRWIARFERSMQDSEHAGSLDPDIVEFSSKCLKMKCTAMEGDGREALAQCEELSKSGHEIKPSLMSMIYQSLGEAYERIGNMAQAQETYLLAQASASVDETMHQLLFNSFSYAEVQYCFGELDGAQENCERLLRTCPPDFALYGAICALLARILLERNEKERAAVLLERSLKRTSYYRHIDMFLEAKIVQVGCLAAEGNLSEAYETIIEGILHGEQIGVPRAVLLHAYFKQAEVAACRCNLHDLLVIERKFATRVHEEDVYCQLLLSYIRALIERQKGNAAAAIDAFRGIAVQARANRFVSIAVKALVDEALVLQASGDEAHARARLNEVLILASRHGFVRSLLDAGEPLRDMLRDYAVARKAGAGVRSYVKSLLVEFEKELTESPQGISDERAFANDGLAPLTSRELEILKLLNMGMSRQEISEALCISVNTAKKHLASIYSKLGVGSREEALGKYAAETNGEHSRLPQASRG